VMRKKRDFNRHIARRFFIRFHMSLILIGTILTGLLFSKLLLLAHLDKMSLRYPAVVLISYFCFFVFIRLWLLYIRSKGKVAEAALDVTADIVSGIDDFPGQSASNVVEFGGGEFSGGGASGAFGETGVETILGDTSAGLGEAAGEAGGSLLEEGGIILIPLMLLLAAIFGVGFLLIYQAPFILSEAAFEFILASALVKKVKEIDNPDWVGSVFRNTWKPFLFTLLLAGIASGLLNHYFPEATKLTQIFL
jgi:hypothetical protein